MHTHEFAVHDGQPLQLDVHPASGSTGTDAGTVVYLHGGGFMVGDRGTDAQRVGALAAHGLTVVVPDYRMAPAARFPDQVDDVRAALRWVNGNQDVLGTTNPKVALWGASAGAVLAALTALTTDVPDSAGSSGDTDQLQAVVFWFGFSDIVTSGSRSPLEAAILPHGAENALLGVEDLSAVPDLVRRASPISHVGPDAPPFLIAHGDRDHVVAVQESQQLHDALVRAGASSLFIKVGGAGHEDPRFDEPAMMAMTAAFLRSHLALH